MNCKPLFTSALAACLLFACTVPALAQHTQHFTPGIPGYLDARGGFHVLPPLAVDENEIQDAVTTFTGTIVVNFTITVSSTIPTTDKISCLASASVFDTGSSGAIEETAAVAATRTGATATCKVTIPYSWPLVSGTTDQVSLTYEVSAPGLFTATNGLPLRTSTQSITHIAVPKTGTTTTENVAATI